MRDRPATFRSLGQSLTSELDPRRLVRGRLGVLGYNVRIGACLAVFFAAGRGLTSTNFNVRGGSSGIDAQPMWSAGIRR